MVHCYIYFWVCSITKSMNGGILFKFGGTKQKNLNKYIKSSRFPVHCRPIRKTKIQVRLSTTSNHNKYETKFRKMLKKKYGWKLKWEGIDWFSIKNMKYKSREYKKFKKECDTMFYNMFN